jgi:hypothetical protein
MSSDRKLLAQVRGKRPHPGKPNNNKPRDKRVSHIAKSGKDTAKQYLSHRQHPAVQKALQLLHSNLLEDEKSSPIIAAARSMLSEGVYRIRLAYGNGYTGVFFTAIGTTGVLAYSRAFYSDISSSSDWSALASLFDECIMDDVEYHMIPYSAGFNVSTPGITVTAFDDDGTPPTLTYDSVASYQGSQFHCPAVQGSTLGTEANSTGFKPITLRYKRPYHVSDNQPMVQDYTTGWIDVAAINQLLGNVLVYNNQVNSSNNVAVYQYVFVGHMRFRCRR